MSQIINDRQSIAHSPHPAIQILWRIALTLAALVGFALAAIPVIIALKCTGCVGG